MLILKERNKSKLLLGLQALDKRMNLSESDKNYLLNLEKGYDGEELFDSLVKKYLKTDCLVLNDLLLVSGGNSFQVDSILITSDTLYIHEIKNYKGKYQFTSGQLLTVTGQEIVSPVGQINRSKALMKEMIKEFGLGLNVKSSVVFINPSFSLYLAKPSDPFILPNQIETYLKGISQQSFTLSKEHRYLANKLMQEHREEVPYQKYLPDYQIGDLKRELYCTKCSSASIKLTKRRAYCSRCTLSMTIDKLLEAHISEFILLFPNEKVTVKKIHQWCGGRIYHRKVRTVLIEQYEKRGKTSNVYYV
ncbi:Nuclease-related domain-containing protein [Alkalibacterium subtropicum]|uniref:Nuclease-related domain-containing protein n=1 Tax=Alkalibacterium subtropicum TaxID=753702 RepID=A0A1I1GJZ8_9LACT|nr:nuclease-related domain-containing protein [Alkalibacterium subtropicum]SFC11851.1 Nuclease-related domain-containing protein [Alkalibacterium subtropicum]